MLYTAHLAQVAFLGEPLIVIKIKGHYCLDLSLIKDPHRTTFISIYTVSCITPQ